MTPGIRERFYSKVDTNGPLSEHRPDLGPCHLWTASTNVRRGGYGQFSLGGRTRKAHAVALELAGLAWSDDLVPDHLCRRPACVRVSHLELVSRGENFRRGFHPTAVALRAGRCGVDLHDMTGANVIKRRNGRRECRACVNRRQKVNRARRAAKTEEQR